MSNKEDEILYKIVLKNSSEEDYEINKNSINISSDYIDYFLESDDTNIVRANSTKTIYLRVKYSKEVEQNKFKNGVYHDDATMKLNLRTGSNFTNPETGIAYMIIISIFIFLFFLTLLVYKKKKLSTLILILSIITLPVLAEALCKCEITIDSKVIIKIEDEFNLGFFDCQYNNYPTKLYKVGMSMNEYFNSEYFTTLVDTEEKNDITYYLTNSTFVFANKHFDECVQSISKTDAVEYTNELKICLNQNSEEVDMNQKIKSKEYGTYIIYDDKYCGIA